MFELITIGSMLFWVVVPVFTVWGMAAFVSSYDHEFGSDAGPFGVVIMFLLAIAAICLCIADIPYPDWQWLISYPLLGLVWLPLHWFLLLISRARKMAETIKADTSDDLAYNKITYEQRQWLTKDCDWRNGQLELDHPNSSMLVLHSFLWPISVFAFFTHGLFVEAYRICYGLLDKARKSVSNWFLSQFNMDKD